MTSFAQTWGKGAPVAVIKGSLLTLAMVFLNNALPVAGMAAGVLVPFPCILYSIKFGRKAGFAIAAIVTATLAAFDRSALLLYLLQSVTCSLLLPELLLRGKGTYKSIFYSVAANALVVLLYAAMLVHVHSVDVDGQIRAMAHDAMTQVGEAYRQSGVSDSDLKGLQAVLQQAENLLIMIYPALFIVFLAICAGCNVLLLNRTADPTGRTPKLGRFSTFRNPDALVWLLIVSGFALLADISIVDRLATNALAVLAFLYLLQGVAVADWLVHKYSKPRLLMALLCVILLLQPLFAVLIAAVGLIDLWADFRAPKQT